jgi:formylglycine-generating enzyme required for sulfatase activity
MSRRLTRLPVAAALAVLAGLAAVPAADKTAPAPSALPAKNFTEVLPGGAVKFEMVYVPGGTFEMGSPEGEPGRKDDEGPRHPVTVGAFWVGRHEVTWDEFDIWWKNESLPVFPKDPPYGRPDALTRPTNPYVDETYDHGREGFPAICMTHHAAMMYCHWLRTVTKKNYRLPTEAEWEYACRAGATATYTFGADAEKLDRYAWYKANTRDNEHPK